MAVRPSSSALASAEVGDPDHSDGIEQQVRRLDVAVDHASGMSVGQPMRGLPADPSNALEERQAPARRLNGRNLGTTRQHGGR